MKKWFFIFLFISTSSFSSDYGLDHHYYLPVDIAGKNYAFMFNTGATFSVISDSVRAENDLEVINNKTFKVSLNREKIGGIKAYALPRITAHLNRELEIKGLQPILIDLNNFNKIDGMIGLDVINSNDLIWEFDNINNTVLMYKKNIKLKDMKCTPYVYENDSMLISLSNGKKAYTFSLDSGNDYSIVNNSIFNEMSLNKMEKKIRSKDVIGNKMEYEGFILKGMLFNNEAIKNLDVIVSDENSSLGNNFIRSFDRFIIDAHRKHICVKARN